MRLPVLRTAALALALLLAAAVSAGAVVIYFKDGSKEVIAESYRIDGSHLIATLQSGQVISLPVDEVDLPKTEANQELARGSAKVIDTPATDADVPRRRERTLADLMRDRPAPATPPAASSAPRTLRRTPSGNVDFLVMARQSLEPERAQAILDLLRRQGVRDAQVFRGTSSRRVLVDIVTAARGDVFAALEGCAAALEEIQASFAEIEALELVMSTATRSRGGQFVLTPQDARRLRSGEVTAAEHFVEHVLF